MSSATIKSTSVTSADPVKDHRATSQVAACVCVVIVTWNRYSMLVRVLSALARQGAVGALTHVVIVDNASTDSTLEKVQEHWHVDAVIENKTEAADQPNFQVVSRNGSGALSRGEGVGGGGDEGGRWGSLTVIRNSHNLGGCGGFNTGFGFIEQRSQGRFDGVQAVTPDYVWLVDDDADLPPDAMENLLRVMVSDEKIGLVGSRTVDIDRRDTTIETTIYFDRRRGVMCPEPPEHHPRFEQYREWVLRVGSRVGRGDFTGTLDVDVVSACSMLARWGAVVGEGEGKGKSVEGVGFWDRRYFIYCDDADWCLRFARAGWRVVLSLDAVVYHTPWLMKLTPQRVYYAQRNAAWMMRKVIGGSELRRVTRMWMRNLLKDAWRAMTHRRLFHAAIIMRTIGDTIDNRGGKTAPEGPKSEPIRDVIVRVAGKRGGSSETTRGIGICVPHQGALESAKALMRECKGLGVRWVLMVSNRVPGFADGPDYMQLDHCTDLAGTSVRCVVYGSRLLSKIRKQEVIARHRLAGVVVFDQTNDLPMALAGGWNVHIDTKSPAAGQLERESMWNRLEMVVRFAVTAVRAARYVISIRQDETRGRYG